MAVIVMESISASELYMRQSKSCIKMQLILVDICKAKMRILGVYNSAVMGIIPFLFYDKKKTPSNFRLFASTGCSRPNRFQKKRGGDIRTLFTPLCLEGGICRRQKLSVQSRPATWKIQYFFLFRLITRCHVSN